MVHLMESACFKINHYQTTSLGSNQSEKSNEIITLVDGWSPPLIFYTDNLLCGPIAKIFEELSRIYGFRLKRIKFNYVPSTLMDDNRTSNGSIALYPLNSYSLETIEEAFGDSFMASSRTLDMESEGHILSKIEAGERDVFEFIHGFDYSTWIALFLCMPLIPLTIALIDKTFKGFFANLWYYSYLNISEMIPSMPRSPLKRFIISFWLLACVVLLGGYGGVLREFFIRPTPVKLIDSWQDLYENKELRIATIQFSYINDFAIKQSHNDEMALDFSQRIDITYEWYERAARYFYERIASGKYVISLPKCFLIDLPMYLTNSTGLAEINKTHLSRSGGIVTPVFLPLRKSLNKTIKTGIDKVISRAFEFGLFIKWKADAERLKYRYYYREVPEKKLETKVISFYRIEGVFLLWSIGITIAILVFIIEVLPSIKKGISNKIHNINLTRSSV